MEQPHRHLVGTGPLPVDLAGGRHRQSRLYQCFPEKSRTGSQETGPLTNLPTLADRVALNAR